MSRAYTAEDVIDVYEKLDKDQREKVARVCTTFDNEPDICAYYENMEDFYTDWIEDNRIFKTEEEADERYEEGVENGEFIPFDSGEIVRIVT